MRGMASHMEYAVRVLRSGFLKSYLHEGTYIADLIIPTFLLLIPMLGFWDLSSCLSVFLRFLWVVPQQKVRLR